MEENIEIKGIIVNETTTEPGSISIIGIKEDGTHVKAEAIIWEDFDSSGNNEFRQFPMASPYTYTTNKT